MGSATSIQEGSGHQPLLDDDYVDDDYEGHDDNGYEEHDDDDYEEHDDDGYVDDDNDGIEEEDVTIMVTIMGNMVVMRKVMTLKVKNKIFNVTESIVGSRCVLPRGRG